MRKPTLYGHQGDVEVLWLGKSKPKLDGYLEITEGEFIIAFGETSGHRHRVVGERVRFFRASDGLSAYVLLDGDGMLVHDDVNGGRGDHGPHALGKGWTRFGRQREASLEDAGWRTVQD